jgi:hypothetical protein
MTCCEEFTALVGRELAAVGPKHLLRDGRIVNEADTDYFLVFVEEGRRTFVGIHYCPFCGRIVSRELWNREKKK